MPLFEIDIENFGRAEYENEKKAREAYNNYIYAAQFGDTQLSYSTIALLKDSKVIDKYVPVHFHPEF
jgi:hypothetical protein